MPHKPNTILMPERIPPMDDLLFDVPWRSYAGKPIVIMLPVETQTELGGVPWLYTDHEAGKHHTPDIGIVVKFTPRRDSEGEIIYAHDRALFEAIQSGPKLVAVKPYTGVWYTSADFPWVPEGRTVKILGTVEPWTENLLAEFVFEDAA